ncbi:MAG: hypothetical protein HQL87_11265 [Magnetococcales bacterium]|nr:hypothetical protein [Magnetococcales bacterium]
MTRSGNETPWEMAIPDPGPDAILASGEQAGETFVFKVEGVNLDRGQGAMLPIVSAPVEVERLTLFDTTLSGGGRSMRALKVVNTTGGALSPGPVTLYDGDLYAGEARFEHLSAGADQLLSYALDLDVEVVHQSKPSQHRLESVKVVKGVLELSRREKRTHRYHIRNRGKESRQVVVIQPREAGWDVVAPADRKATGRNWRFPLLVAGEAAMPLEIEEEHLQSQQVTLLHTSESALRLLVAEEGMEASMRKALEGVLARQRELEEVEQQIKVQQEELHRLEQEQARLRDNLKTAPGDSHFHARMLEKLDAVENRIEEVSGQAEKLRKELENGKAALEKELMQMS